MLQRFKNSYFLLKLYLVRYGEARKEKKNSKQSIRSVISGKILRKYKLIHHAARRTNTDWRKLSKGLSKVINPNKSKRGFEPNLYKAVINFYNRDDVLPHSTENATPKKVKQGKPCIQKRVLNDYLSNLHQKLYLSILTCRVHSHLSLEWGLKTLYLQNLQIGEPVRAHNIKVTLWSWKCLENTQAFLQTQKHLSNTVIRKSRQLLTI